MRRATGRLIPLIVVTALALAACTVADTTAPVTGTTPEGQDLPASSDLLVVGD